MPSRLLGKVARGIDLPVNEIRTIYRGEDSPENETGWEGGYPGTTSEEISLTPGESKEDSYPVSDIKPDGLMENNKAGQNILSDNKKEDINQKYEHLSIEGGIEDNTLISEISEQKNKLVNGFTDSHPNNVEHVTVNPEDREIPKDSNKYISKEVSVQDGEIDFKKTFYQRLNAGDFQSGKKYVEPPVLKPFVTAQNPETQKKTIAEKHGLDEDGVGAASHLIEKGNSAVKIPLNENDETISGGGKNTGEFSEEEEHLPLKKNIAPQGVKAEVDDKYFQKKNHIEVNRAAVSPEKEILKKTGHLIHQDYPVIKKPIFKNHMPIDRKDTPIIKEIPKHQKGNVRIGKINIHIKGREKAEEEQWPEAPDYTDHVVTEDWEWSCLYRR